MTKIHWLILVATTALSAAISLPASAQVRPISHWPTSTETVSAVTPTTLVVKHAQGVEQKLAMSQIGVKAAMYPATRGILRPGERVTLFQEPDIRPLVVVHPEIYGKLAQSGSTWTVTSKRSGTTTLTGSNPELLGMTQWHSGDRVLVFGSAIGPHQVDASAVAAMPLMAHSTVQSASANALTLKSDDYGTLTYSLKDLPGHLRQHLSALAPGQNVIASLDPLTRHVLMVWPDHMERWARALERGTAGQVVAISPQDLTLTNHLGTVTIPLNHPAQVRWMGHKAPQLKDIHPGARVLVIRERDGNLNLMVLTKK